MVFLKEKIREKSAATQHDAVEGEWVQKVMVHGHSSVNKSLPSLMG
jgi:hypothetical protein